MKAVLPIVALLVTVAVACGSGGSSTGGNGGAGGAGGSGGGTASQPKLSPPDCGTPPSDAGTANDIFADIVIAYGCSAGGCHGVGTTPVNHYTLSDAASLRTAWISAPADERPGFNRITPGNVDTSYVLYKLLDQQHDAGGSGDQMPQGGPYLSDGDVCKVVNWVKAGAP